MSLEKRIYRDYLEALKSKNRSKTDFLSFIRSELKNQAIDLRKDSLADQEVLAVLKKQQKRLNDAYEDMAKSPRQDFLESLKKELAILDQYLPLPLSDEEILEVIERAILQENACSMKDMGRIMKKVLAEVGLQADSRKVSTLVKEKLSQL